MSHNIEALRAKQAREQENAGHQVRLADSITAFSGSMLFVYIHLIVVALWIAVNVGWLPWIEEFDPTFVILATVASVEAIFLSTFVLISQNRAATLAQKRSELDLQTSLLAEYEVTRILMLTVAIAQHLGIKESQDPALHELQRYVSPEKVLDEINQQDPKP